MNSLLILLLEAELFGIEMFDNDLYELAFRFFLNLGVSVIIIRYLYYAVTRRKDYLFTYILISTTVFFLCFLLENVKLQIGFALGLFAIFGIIRYRTQQIPIKEMTYLFIIIGISVINALANKKISFAELIFANFAIIAIIYGLEKVWLLKHESSKRITYEKIELIKPENREALHKDLEERTGLKINRIEVDRINFLRDTARLIIHYLEKDNMSHTAYDDDERYDDDDD